METKREVVSSLYNGNREYMYREESCSEGIVRCASIAGRCYRMIIWTNGCFMVLISGDMMTQLSRWSGVRYTCLHLIG